MTWKKLLGKKLIREHETNPEEIKGLYCLITRDLEDAQIKQLSVDRRFATAYNAALNLARLSVFVAGYRILSAAGHHRTSFEAALLALGSEAEETILFFDLCRKKRNSIEYDQSEITSESELEELIDEVLAFQKVVKEFVRSKS